MPTENEKRKEAIKKKARRRRNRRILLITVSAVVLIAALAAGLFLYFRYRTFGSYTVRSNIEMSTSGEQVRYTRFGAGYLKLSGESLTYFDKKGVIWDQSLGMTQPIMDVCGDYAAVADMKKSDVYLFDRSGLVGTITTTHYILDVEVSKSGVVAISTNDKTSNYIELRDRYGQELVTAKSIFSSSGYLADITLSDDGDRLAAAFISISQGSLESKILFYDFTKSTTGDDALVGGFNQYEGTLLTDVRFMKDNTVCAIGDNAMTFYSFSGTPSIISETLELEYQIQSLFMSDKYVGIIVLDDTSAYNYRAKIFDTAGKLIADIGFDYSYSKADFAGNNIVLYGSSDCQIYSFSGFRRFSYSFDEPITCLYSLGDCQNFIYASVGAARFIRLK